MDHGASGDVRLDSHNAGEASCAAGSTQSVVSNGCETSSESRLPFATFFNANHFRKNETKFNCISFQPWTPSAWWWQCGNALERAPSLVDETCLGCGDLDQGDLDLGDLDQGDPKIYLLINDGCWRPNFSKEASVEGRAGERGVCHIAGFDNPNVRSCRCELLCKAYVKCHFSLVGICYVWLSKEHTIGLSCFLNDTFAKVLMSFVENVLVSLSLYFHIRFLVRKLSSLSWRPSESRSSRTLRKEFNIR